MAVLANREEIVAFHGSFCSIAAFLALLSYICHRISTLFQRSHYILPVPGGKRYLKEAFAKSKYL